MLVSKFLDPKNDIAFKRIFGSEKNKDILIHFLNDMITFKDNAIIQDVSFLKTVQDPDIASKKTSVVDILCQDNYGNNYVVEMKVAKEKGFEKRAQYYAAKAYISQMNVGGQYHDLKEVIFLAISNFIIFQDKIEYKSDHITLDRKTGENDLKGLSFTFVELPKFNKDIHELTTLTEKWCYFFKHAQETSEQDFKQFIASDPIHNQIIERAYEELNRFSWNEDEIRTYDQALKYEWDQQAIIDQKYDDGLAKGKFQERILIAKNMLAAGLSIQQIADFTSLSVTEIEKIEQ